MVQVLHQYWFGSASMYMSSGQSSLLAHTQQVRWIGFLPPRTKAASRILMSARYASCVERMSGVHFSFTSTAFLPFEVLLSVV